MEQKVILTVSNDKRSAYLRLTDNNIAQNVVLDGYESVEAKALKGEVILDLDKDGHLVGIELQGPFLEGLE